MDRNNRLPPMEYQPLQLHLDNEDCKIGESFSYDGKILVRDLVAGQFRAISHLCPPRIGRRRSLKQLQDAWDQCVLTGVVPVTSAEPKLTIRIADLFSGGGGLSFGVKSAVEALGCKAEFAFSADVDPDACGVYAINLRPHQHVTKNVAVLVDFRIADWSSDARFSYAPEIVDPKLAQFVGAVDLLLAGPPCQGHSNLNNRSRRDDPRNLLYLTVPAIAVAVQAPLVLIENVPDIRNAKISIIDTARALFEKSGYLVDEAIVSGFELGIPQTRKRHLMVASLKAKPNIRGAATALARTSRDVRWAIGDLLGCDRLGTFDEPAGLSGENKDRIEFLFANGLYELPNRQRPICHQDGHTYPAVYGRLKWDEPSGTITSGYMTPGRGRFIHPEEKRTLTAHEAARLQGIPDQFKFIGPNGDGLWKKTLGKLIGDAVPPQIGFAGCIAAMATV